MNDPSDDGAALACPSQQRGLFPWAGDDMRCIPGDLARSSLFTVGQKATRRQLKRERVMSSGSTEITYTGEELRQRDADVFYQLVHLHRGQSPNTPVEFSAHSLLVALSWPTSGRGYLMLKESIERLKACMLKVAARDAAGERAFGGSLVRAFAYSELNSGRAHWRVMFEPAILALFSGFAYTQVEWDQRLALSPLAKWLHSFFHAQAPSNSQTVGIVHRLSGSTFKSQSGFRFKLKSALRELVDCHYLDSWSVSEDGTIVVNRCAG